LRKGSRAEAQAVAKLCKRLDVPHEILTVEWDEKPETAIQERARAARYRLLGEWARAQGIGVVLTAHHLDDQVETFVMRLNRGAGVRGLAAMRNLSKMPAAKMPLVRPLLSWRRSELEQICADAGVQPAADPSNDDEQFERVRVRKALASSDWLDPGAIARSSAYLAQADAALHWATDVEWSRAVQSNDHEIVYRVSDAPTDILRRIVRRSVLRLATEGGGADLRGGELERLVVILAGGGKATLRGVQCVGGKEWRFTQAPARQGAKA
jgi:tRNA(Ile)-lysidine synthase